ncbi:hypothetical protein DAPPUDRAFT_255519 [Daphnia pulex]|uniref:Uncharacterized protein n=1 Tax=Daphnia pulex TaxID=6669 RepID=E9H9D3_DAPPU|nr:hypothetical protein DAPPUDRAFT_255519 [Daphnia pulex]|eukprot:EFX71601.1 hypothetical protein DAPPUDRAFT_255519 [Daphnia pulex]
MFDHRLTFLVNEDKILSSHLKSFRLLLNSIFDSTVIPSLEQTSYSTSDSTPLQSPAESTHQSEAVKIQKDVIRSQSKFNYSTTTDGFHQEQKPQQHITDTNENTLLLYICCTQSNVLLCIPAAPYNHPLQLLT